MNSQKKFERVVRSDDLSDKVLKHCKLVIRTQWHGQE